MEFKIVQTLPADLWIDRAQPSDWVRVSAENYDVVKHFAEEGYCVLKNAIPQDKIDRLVGKIVEINQTGAPDVHYQNPDVIVNVSVTPGSIVKGRRVVDSHATMKESFDVISSPRVTSVLKSICGENPMLIQSHYFVFGSEQPLHKDNAYVVVDKPLSLVAAWYALEDVREDAGPLMVVPRSHRREHFLFNGDRKHWLREVDGLDMHNEWTNWMHRDFAERGLKMQLPVLKKGDVLLWHGDLAHGGTPVLDGTKTRHSMVGHFCPSSCKPVTPFESTAQKGDLAVKSVYYDVAEVSWLK